MNEQKGFTVIEFLIVVGIMMVLAGIVLSSFRGMTSSKSLDGDVYRIIAELNRARSYTLASKYSTQYGVHMGTSSITLFEGGVYSSGSASNTVTTLSPLVQIASTTLTGGGSDVIFQRLTGGTSQNGTIKISLKAATTSKTIQIYKTGAVEIQ